MKIAGTKLKKTVIVAISSIIIAVMVVILFISPIAKYLIERYDEKYTGRQINTGLVYVNPFTGYIHISNLKIHESKTLPDSTKGDSLFFSAKGLNAKFTMFKLLSKTIEISEVTLDHPKGIIIQNKKDFNFNDLIKKFTREKSNTASSPVHFSILKIKIKNGEFHYREEVIPVNYYIREVNLESKGKYWKSDTISTKFSFLSGTGSGSAEGNITINFKNLDYRLDAVVHKFDLKFIEQYLKDLVNYGTFRANLDADIKAAGNFKDQEDLNASGMLAINEFHLGKTNDEDYASFDQSVLVIDELSPKKHRYYFDSVLVSHPYFKYERYDSLDNLQRMFGKNGVNLSAASSDPGRFNLIIEIADYIKSIAKNFYTSDYRINRLSIDESVIKFNDYSIAEKFSIEANPLFIVADSVNKNRKRVEVFLKSGIQPYGNISVSLSINPKDSGDYDFQYHVKNLPATIFNPYLITYTSFPLDRGTIELNGIWKVRKGNIKSENHFLVIDPQVTRGIKNKDAKKIPLPLIMLFIREPGNVIDYQIPINGNLKDPKFHMQDVIFDILGNIFVKPAATPYLIQVKILEDEIEKSLALKWNLRQSSILPDQEKFVNKMADFLSNNPEASITVYPMQYAEKEKEYIRFFEAKKKYFLLSKDKKSLILSKDDSLTIDKMSVKDSLFVRYLNKQVNDSMIFTIQDKCNKFIGTEVIDAKFKQLNEEREAAFMLFFKKKDVESRIKIYSAENNVPYNGFSFYKIVYNGEYPGYLIKAYRQMNELNNKAPRKLFEKEREESRKTLNSETIL